jgi:serine O-acetyltransferase
MDLKFAQEILTIRHAHLSAFPSKNQTYKFINDLIELLFPHFSGEKEYFVPEEIAGKLALIERDLKSALRPLQPSTDCPMEEITGQFFTNLPELYRKLWRDAEAIHQGDPASESIDEVITAYPGFFAIYTYRVAHEFYKCKLPIFPRLLTEYAHYRTGIDIHPGAEIGESFFLDHGTGIVVGETSIIGKNVKIYQGVTLGALSVQKRLANTKRHPTIEDNVVIYSNATILGGKAVIGHDSVVGGNVWLTESVPPYSIVYHTSEIKVRSQKMESDEINFVI